jgi:FMN phosphatase YigB (HAD superfamily)
MRRSLPICDRVEGQWQLYAFSNTNTAQHGHGSFRFAELPAALRKIYVSHELGVCKPARRLPGGIAAERVLIFDDSAENVAGASA